MAAAAEKIPAAAAEKRPGSAAKRTPRLPGGVVAFVTGTAAREGEAETRK